VARVAHHVDHKRIGVIVHAARLVMLLRGFPTRSMMRTSNRRSRSAQPRLSASRHYDQVFFGARHDHDLFRGDAARHRLDDYVVPLSAGGARRRFRVLNSVGFLADRIGRAADINASLVIGNFARTGWNGYPPLSELAFSPDVRRRLLPLVLQISGIGTLLTGSISYHDPQAARPGQ